MQQLAKFGYLRADQIRDLCFQSGTTIGRTRRCQAVLRRLTTDGFLYRLERSVGGRESGSSQFVYCLGYRGQRVAFPGRRPRTPADRSHQFVDHHLAIADIAVQLEHQRLRGTISELGVVCEPQAWRTYLGTHGQSKTLKPDLGVRLMTTSGQRLVWWVEVDRSTESLKRIRTKGHEYLAYWKTGIEQQTLGVFPKVLWSTLDQTRAEQISGTLATLPDPASAMFATASAEHTVDLLTTTTFDGTATPKNRNEINNLKGGEQ